LLILEAGRDRILRLTPTGDTSVFLSFDVPHDGWSLQGNMVFDRTGNLLASGHDWVQSKGTIYRFSPTGARSVFATLPYMPWWITVGPDGDVWVAEEGGSGFSRFDSQGNSKGVVSVAVPCGDQILRVLAFAFSPTGELHFSSELCSGIWKLVNGRPQRVIAQGVHMLGMAFDRDGYLYVSELGAGVRLYDPQYHLIGNPFASSNMNDPAVPNSGPGPLALVFARAADGSMTKRIFVANDAGAGTATVVELNSAGVRAPGWQIGSPSSGGQQSQTVSETEPNNSLQTANLVSLGDSIVGENSSSSDIDWFALDVAAGQQVHVGATPATGQLDVIFSDAAGNPYASFQPQSHDELRQNLWYKPAAPGRYYIAVSAPSQTAYRLAVDSKPVLQGPGDPSANFANIPTYAGAVAGNNVLYVAAQHQIIRIDANGSSSTFATLPNDQGSLTGAIVVDGLGNLLAATVAPTQGIIWRFTPGGTRSEFAHSTGYSTGMTVGPDGDVWIGTEGGPAILRYDAQGRLRDSISARVAQQPNCSAVTYLAFSPAGELHFAAGPCGGLFKLTNNNTTAVQISGYYAARIQGLAFDRDGYLYLVDGAYNANGQNSKVVLLQPSYVKATDPFATDIWTDNYVDQLIFWRDAAGNPTARLFAIANSRIVELNRAGIRAPGWPIGKQSSGNQMQIAVPDIVSALLGGPQLTTDQVQYLDSHGNHNGALDVGDLRAYLRSQGQLPGSKHP
jgi:sugar lactone lactonase YvrE